MPTEQEWWAIDARLAEDLIGWERDSDGEHWRIPSDPFPALWTAEGDHAFAEETGCPVADPRCVWMPHKNISQAMECKDKIVSQGARFELQNREYDWHMAAFWQHLKGSSVSKIGETDAKAICLAAIAWLDREKETDDA